MADDKKKPIKLNDEQLMLDASNVADIYHQLTLDLFDQVIVVSKSVALLALMITLIFGNLRK